MSPKQSRRRRSLGLALAFAVCLGAIVLPVASCRKTPSVKAPDARSVKPPHPERAAQWPRRELIMGLTPSISAKMLREVFRPLADYLETQLGVKIRIKVAKSYGELALWLGNGTVDFARLSPYNYVLTKKKLPGIALVAREISDGAEHYRSYIIVRRDSGLTSLAQLKGKRFGFVDKRSTSGYLFPLHMLMQQNLDPKRMFSEVRFLGNHLNTVRAVIERRVDAGAVYSSVLESTRHVGLHPELLSIIGKSERIPYDAYCLRPGVSPAFAARLRTLLTSITSRTELGQRILRGATNLNGFVAAKDQDYASIRRVLATVGSGR
ncbi:MAG: phosphate/phosphite/phosphonate ABC transporter substrate-binding protein [Myxococcales bacterium]|nr:phosphate/phosphite/phosphonate ABC transporter substrate-binding protein [Myxococcales bacterium]